MNYGINSDLNTSKVSVKLTVRMIFATGLVLFLFQGCAKVGRPTGGPKDVNPPKYVSGQPENRATQVTDKDIAITFDEYIQLKDQAKEIVISPPLKERPVIRVRDKDIRIGLNNELLPQTTYTLNFGKAISDLNESNPLPDFEFVFSTGDQIDSLSVTGKIVEAFNLQPDEKEGITVLIYENLADSAPLIEIPRYYGRANKNGLFSVNNIRPDTFRIIALKDENNNLRYDPGAESIAFLDSLLILSAGNVTPQTFIKDTIKIITPAGRPVRGGKKGSTPALADTVIAPGKVLNALNIKMFYFLEPPEKVFLTSRKRESNNMLSFIFSRSPYDTVRMSPLIFKPAGDWFVKETSVNSDTLTYWITDSLVAQKDTLKLILNYLTTDSTGLFTEKADTVNMRYQQPVGKGSSAGRRAKAEVQEVTKKTLNLSGNVKNKGILDLNSAVIFTADKPLQSIDNQYIELYKIIDSLSFKQEFTCIKDSFSIRRFRVESKWEEDCRYRILLKPGTATDILGVTNDSVEIGFGTQKTDYYARILLTIEGGQYPMVVQVLDPKDRVVKSMQIEQPGITVFDFLSPGQFSLKAVYDKNGNGIWDTGNYLKHVQPEKVYLNKMVDQLRSGWDHEVNWIISD